MKVSRPALFIAIAAMGCDTTTDASSTTSDGSFHAAATDGSRATGGAGPGSEDARGADGPTRSPADGQTSVGANHVVALDGPVPFVAEDAMATQMVGSGFNFNGAATFVVITEASGSCDSWARNCCPRGQEIAIGLAAVDGSGKASPPTAPGTFVIGSAAMRPPPNSNAAEVYYTTCGPGSSFASASGTVTVTGFASDGLSPSGTFDATLTCESAPCPPSSNHRFTGSFKSAACSSLDVNRTVSVCP